MKLLKKIGLALSLMLVLVPCLNLQAKDITNKTTQLLPETGSNGTILLIGLGVAVIAFALYMSKKEKLNSK